MFERSKISRMGSLTVNSFPPLLRLPAEVRWQIYSYLDILGYCHSQMPAARRMKGFYSVCVVDTGDSPGIEDCLRDQLHETLALMRTCKAIYDEVSYAVYSRIHWVADCKQDAAPMWRLRPSSIRALTRLSINLHTVCCERRWICERHGDPWEPRHREPLDASNPKAQSILREWNKAWSDHFRPSMAPTSQLELTFICDVANYDTGLLAVQPFLTDSHARVAKCSIRLCDKRNAQLAGLAEKAVRFLVGQHAEPDHQAVMTNHRSFQDLPTKVRQHILSYTNLVTPDHEVEWSPKYNMFLRKQPRRSCQPAGYGDRLALWGENPHSRLAQACREGTTVVFKEDMIGCDACVCPACHAAFSSFRECQCWRAPTDFFLVSREFQKDAQEVFWSQNKFVISSDMKENGFHADITSIPGRLPITTFLMDIVPRPALRHLRSIEIVYGAFAEGAITDFCPNDSPELQSFIGALRAAREMIDLPKLRLQVVFARNTHREYEDMIRYKYCFWRCLFPLLLWRVMGKFFIHIMNCPYSQVHHLTEAWEESLESVIMGDDYDSERLGKREYGFGNWIIAVAEDG